MGYSSVSDVYGYNWLVAEMSATCVQLFSYGIYLNLFILSLHILRRRKTGGYTLHLASTWTMLTLATTEVVIHLLKTAVVVQFVGLNTEQGITPPPIYGSLTIAHKTVLILNGLLVDTLFLYRCFVIWGSRWAVVVIPAILIAATTVAAFTALSPDAGERLFASLILEIAANMTLMTLTAGRIWWIRRDALRVATDRVLLDRYTTVIAMILESGAIYFLFPILVIVVYPWNIPFYVMDGLGTYLINIIPTLVLVRVGLGRSFQDTVDRQTASHIGRRTRAEFPTPLSEHPGPQILDIQLSREEKEGGLV
ncbi:hypothetical protein B0H16DRAFT_1560198 [Mycena metata]|uniref:Uncharacterized protein n=1 Tax=Mycena metata TaxID=1033252 RepID=A0AAD7N3H6_9AGAR|nr:hypothetical protein B0H16DRAFT_1560198 [Mycena metata]